MKLDEFTRIITSFLGIWFSLILLSLLIFNTRVTKWTCFLEIPIALMLTWAIWKRGDEDAD